MTSRFREILDDDFQTTSPESDVKLEDILNASVDLSSSRSRTSSEDSGSGASNSSSEYVNHVIGSVKTNMKEPQPQKRRSRLLSLGRR